jgi:hypothetical protein
VQASAAGWVAGQGQGTRVLRPDGSRSRGRLSARRRERHDVQDGRLQLGAGVLQLGGVIVNASGNDKYKMEATRNGVAFEFIEEENPKRAKKEEEKKDREEGQGGGQEGD